MSLKRYVMELGTQEITYNGADRSVKVPRQVRQAREYSCTLSSEKPAFTWSVHQRPTLDVPAGSPPCGAIPPEARHLRLPISRVFPNLHHPVCPLGRGPQRGDFAATCLSLPRPVARKLLAPQESCEGPVLMNFLLFWVLPQTEFNCRREILRFLLDPAHWFQTGIWNSLPGPTGIMWEQQTGGGGRAWGASALSIFLFQSWRQIVFTTSRQSRCINVLDG